jgi:hypothetical protein
MIRSVTKGGAQNWLTLMARSCAAARTSATAVKFQVRIGWELTSTDDRANARTSTALEARGCARLITPMRAVL